MLEEEKLIPTSDNTLVIPGRHAWPEYNEFNAYVCQPNRTFRQVSHIAFYTKNQIQQLIPTILESYEEIEMTRGKYTGKKYQKLNRLIEYLLDQELRTEGVRYKVIFLTPPEDPRTIHLDTPIQNDLRSVTGRTTAFTQNQRYVSLGNLKKARRTSELCEQDPKES
jgi:hypothetical protein